jgi:hypothetical protein
MKNLLKLGGIGALIGATTNLFALGAFSAFLMPNGIGADPLNVGKIVAFLAGNQSFMRIFNIISYLVFGVGLIFLAMALYERLKSGSTVLAQSVSTLGLIYAVVVIMAGTLALSNLDTVVKLYGENPVQAATAWMTLESVETGLGGGGGETMVNALWLLLISGAALRAKEFPKLLNYFGLVIGAAGIVTVLLPSLLLIAVVYGLGLIFWFIWMGIVLLRGNLGKPVTTEFISAT